MFTILTSDLVFIIFNAFLGLMKQRLMICMAKDTISRQNALQIAADFMMKRKNTEKIDIATVEQNREDWVVRGTCPIDMEGHPWAEKFEVVVDPKGRIKSTYSSLL